MFKTLVAAASLVVYASPVAESYVPDGYTEFNKVPMLLSTQAGLRVYYLDVALPKKDGKPVVCRFLDEKSIECLMADAEGAVLSVPYQTQLPVKS